jgi:nitrogen fixation/metabolism regulation signal transduction histidine kinase
MYRVSYPKSDAVGFLVDNFNQMTDEHLSSREKLYNAQRLAAWQEVARRLAHEIKNPLTPIRLSAERLLRQVRRDGADVQALIEKMIPTILGEVQVIEELVNEFSSFARLPELHLERVDAVAFFREVVVSYDGAPEDSPLRFASTPAVLMCLLDKTQMRRAVSNLLQNALRAIAGRAGGTTSHLDRIAGGLVLAVSDNGRDSEEIRANIFQPYFTASEGGTGLGLPIVEKIVLSTAGASISVP